jgi:hypothetical protein
VHGDFRFDGLKEAVGSLCCLGVGVAPSPAIDDEEYDAHILVFHVERGKPAQRLSFPKLLGFALEHDKKVWLATCCSYPSGVFVVLGVSGPQEQLHAGFLEGAVPTASHVRRHSVLLEERSVAFPLDESAPVGHQGGDIDIVNKEVPLDSLHGPGGARVGIKPGSEKPLHDSQSRKLVVVWLEFVWRHGRPLMLPASLF